MKKRLRKCLKCGRPAQAGRWLCPACRQENENYSSLAEGVSDLYDFQD